MSKNENIGILDPEGKNPNPLTGQPYTQQYHDLVPIWTKQPIYKMAREIIKDINDNQVILLTSGTGSGKTLLLPLYALHHVQYKGKVVITMPKKLLTGESSSFAAKRLDVELGEEVGFQYRASKLSDGRSSKSKKTRLLYSTTGSVVAQLINDPALKEYDVVIVDEAHERQLEIDFLLLLMKRALKLNPKLKLIIMSATVNADIFGNYFKKDFKYKYIDVKVPVLYKPEIIYEYKETPKDMDKNYLEYGIKKVVDLIKKNEKGDILLFVPSTADTNKGCKLLADYLKKNGINKQFCIEVYGDIVKDEIKKKLISNRNAYKSLNGGPYDRKIVMATNAVESSLTVDGLKYVVDLGLELIDGYNPDKMERSLLRKYVSKAQAKQRAGRVARTEPGKCYRMYSKKDYENFLDYPKTAIKRTDLTDYIYQFMKLPQIKSVKDVLELLKELIEPPEASFVKSALMRLFALGLIDKMTGEGKLTQLGKDVLKFKRLDYMQGIMVIKSYEYQVEWEIVTLSAMLNRADGRLDTFLRKMKLRPDDRGYKQEKMKYDKIRKALSSQYGDIVTFLKIYEKFKKYRETHNEQQLKKWCYENYLSYDDLKMIPKMIKDIIKEAQDIFDPRNYSNKKTQPQKAGAKANKTEGVILSYLSGTYINLTRQFKNNMYQNCFPPKRSLAQLSRDSTLSEMKTLPKYMIYWELADILGTQKYNLCTKIPENFLKTLHKGQLNLIKDCFKPIKFKSDSRDKKKQFKQKQFKGKHKKSPKGKRQKRYTKKSNKKIKQF